MGILIFGWDLSTEYKERILEAGMNRTEQKKNEQNMKFHSSLFIMKGRGKNTIILFGFKPIDAL